MDETRSVKIFEGKLEGRQRRAETEVDKRRGR
jgi:hypothetical protein